MLGDGELQALRDIERRLRWESPEWVRLFDSAEPQPETDHRQRARTRVLLAAAAVSGLALLGPRMLNEADVRTQRRARLPRTAPADTAGRTAPVSGLAAPAGLVAVVDIFVAPSTFVATTAVASGVTFRQDSSPSSSTVSTTEAREELERK